MKFLFIMLTTLLFSFSALAGTTAQTAGAKYDLNRANPNAMQKWQLGTAVIDNRIHVARAVYDFSVLGGAVGTLTLKGVNGEASVVIPNKAVIIDCLIDVQTPLTTSASGTVSFGANSTVDLKAALAAASYTGRVACIPVGTAATAVKVTADRTLSAAIATGAITAGKFTVLVQYILSQ